jgi:hypothetical protein
MSYLRPLMPPFLLECLQTKGLSRARRKTWGAENPTFFRHVVAGSLSEKPTGLTLAFVALIGNADVAVSNSANSKLCQS